MVDQSTLPDRLAVLGLGGVGTELAQALARLGCTVTAFDGKPMLAGLSDPEVSAALLRALRTELVVHLGHEVELASDGDGDALRVTGGGVSVVVDRVVVALGRTPNLAGLGLETLGVPLDQSGRPEVDPSTLRIGETDVFLVGDAAGDRPIQHEAADEGHIAGLNARTGALRRYRRRTPLSIVFTDPTVALVGTHHDKLDLEQVVIGEASFADQGRARLGIRGDGCLRVYAAKESGVLVGAELCTPDGEHLAHILALAIERACTVADLLRAVLSPDDRGGPAHGAASAGEPARRRRRLRARERAGLTATVCSHIEAGVSVRRRPSVRLAIRVRRSAYNASADDLEIRHAGSRVASHFCGL
jgi:dihydrolipoamide dehydrogenase